MCGQNQKGGEREQELGDKGEEKVEEREVEGLREQGEERAVAWSSVAVAICCGSATAADSLDLELPTTAKVTKINKGDGGNRERDKRGEGREEKRDRRKGKKGASSRDRRKEIGEGKKEAKAREKGKGKGRNQIETEREREWRWGVLARAAAAAVAGSGTGCARGAYERWPCIFIYIEIHCILALHFRHEYFQRSS